MKRDTATSIFDCLILLIAIFIPYAQVSGHRFVEFDDGIYTFQNTYIIKGLNWESVVWAFTNTDAANWHPVTWLTHLIDRELFGPSPGGYLLMNVAWHMAAACACYLAFRRCTKQRFFALLIALIFAVHPANVENVAWTSERKSMLDAFFWFTGFLAYFKYLETKQLKFYGILIVTHMLGLMSKAMHVTFPCTLVLVHLLHSAFSQPVGASVESYKTTLIRSLKLTWPLLLLSVYFSAVTALAQTVAMSDLNTMPLSTRLVNVVCSYQRYLKMFFVPTDFAVFYPLFIEDIKTVHAAVPCLLLGVISVLAALLWKRRPELLLGWLWFLGTMVPVIGLVQVGSQSHADRYLYVPMIGLSFLFPALFAELKSVPLRILDTLKFSYAATAAACLIAITFIQVSYWKTGVSLFQNSLKVSGDCLTSVCSLAIAYTRNDRDADAIIFLNHKLEIAKNPANRAKLSSILAMAYFNESKYAKSFEVAESAILTGTRDPSTLVIAALSAYEVKNMQAAETYIKEARRLIPEHSFMATTQHLARAMDILQAKLDSANSLPSL